MRGREFEEELRIDNWGFDCGEVFLRKQILRKSVINLDFALSSIAAKRFVKQILSGLS